MEYKHKEIEKKWPASTKTMDGQAAEIYDHKKIEKYWQDVWSKQNLYKTSDNLEGEKSYVLDMFPYPSGDGLHVGHPKGYIATDIYSRMKRMQGYNVLHPMGWDAFGLPAENFAIKNKIHPKVAVEKNIKRFKEQLEKIGFNYDWEREINTTDPEFYKWTQWIFLKLFEKGLAYESYEPINWCPSCQTGLANEDLESDGTCERCGSKVEKKPMRQWMLKITDYAERLLEDLDSLDWPEYIKESQRNWIGKSKGAEIEFELRGTSNEVRIKVFTTRADTLFGATYLVLAPEHEFIKNYELQIKNYAEVKDYIEKSKNKTEIERGDVKKEKTGIELKGIKAINPATGEEISVWVSDYVLGNYGTGAVMAVPAHDERDFEFAKKYNLPIKKVIYVNFAENNLHRPLSTLKKITTVAKLQYDCWPGEGVLINSPGFNDLTTQKVREKIAEKFGVKVIKYKLRDWVFSRQRYWGEPIPVVHCSKDGVVGVPEKDLPVKLPEVENYEPTGTGESPLSGIPEWVNTTCPKCGGPAKRETNTMPQWAGSSWYYLRFLDPKNSKNLVDPKIEKYWLGSPKHSGGGGVDLYVGGAEHATRHLIYARFWHKFLFDQGFVNFSEPFLRLQNVGLILALDGKKMSKRFGNVINPDDIVEVWGADTLRLYEMFMGPFGDSISWSTDNMIGVRRFLERVWRVGTSYEVRVTKYELKGIIEDQKENSYIVSRITYLESLLHKTIKKVTEDIENFKFNTAISAMMIFVNELDTNSRMDSNDTNAITREIFEIFLKLLAPFAPHLCEELWSHFAKTAQDKSEKQKYSESIHLQIWPKYDQSKIKEENNIIVVQINGKVRANFEVDVDLSEAELKERALNMEEVKKWIPDINLIKKVIFVKNKLINFVI